MFEHGRTGHCVRRSPHEQICHHAHVHVLPLLDDLADHIRLSQSTPWQTWADVGELAGELDGYLVLETGSGRHFYPVTRPLEPHFLRTQAATVAGEPYRADWERVIENPAAQDLVAQARRRLSAGMARSMQRGTLGRGQAPPSPRTTSDIQRSTMSTST